MAALTGLLLGNDLAPLAPHGLLLRQRKTNQKTPSSGPAEFTESILILNYPLNLAEPRRWLGCSASSSDAQSKGGEIGTAVWSGGSPPSAAAVRA
jgi:hypothetical protein